MLIGSYILMCIIFGTTFLFIKIGLSMGWSPFLFSGLRFFIAGLLVMLILRKNSSLSFQLHIQTAVVGLLMTTIPFAALYWGEQYISTGEAAILVATSPIFILILKSILARHQFRFIEMFGAFLCICGIFLTVLKEFGLTSSSEALWSKVYIVLAEMAFAYGSIKSKDLLQRINSPFIFNGLQMLYGGILLLIVGVIFQEDFSLPTYSQGWYILFYFILVASILSYGIYYWLIKTTNPFFSSTWTYVSPVIATLLGIILFDETFGVLNVFGTVLILFGVIISNFNIFSSKKLYSEIEQEG